MSEYVIVKKAAIDRFMCETHSCTQSREDLRAACAPYDPRKIVVSEAVLRKMRSVFICTASNNNSDMKAMIKVLEDEGIVEVVEPLDFVQSQRRDAVIDSVDMRGLYKDRAQQPTKPQATKEVIEAMVAAYLKAYSDYKERGIGSTLRYSDLAQAMYDAIPWPVAAPFKQDAWIGCRECDCSFACHDGKAKCIRLHEPVAVTPAPEMKVKEWLVIQTNVHGEQVVKAAGFESHCQDYARQLGGKVCCVTRSFSSKVTED